MFSSKALGAGALTLACVAAAAVPQLAQAALPRSGGFAGKTTQPDTNPFSGRFKLKVAKLDGMLQLTSVTARVKLDCQGDPAETTTLRFAMPAGAAPVSGRGRFDYTLTTSPTSGFSIKGRFPTRRRATGSFGYSDAHSGCYTGGQVKWSAERTQI